MQNALPQTKKVSSRHGTLNTMLNHAQGFLTKFNNDWTMQSAAALAYNLIVAIVPIIFAVISIFGFTVGLLDPAAKSELITRIEQILPASFSSSKILQVVFISLERNTGFLLIIVTLASIFGGSRLFIAMEGCFDIIYQTYPRKLIAQNVTAILMMLAFVVLIPLLVFTSSVPALLLSLIENSAVNQLPIIAHLVQNSFLLGIASILSSLFFSWILFEAIFSFVPNMKVSFKRSWPGALLSAILLVLFLALFPLYITHFMGSYQGEAGFAIILLVFFYYFAVILLLGAEVNAYFAEHLQPLPNNMAAVLHNVARQVDDKR
jgi:YihY family inner membrane protein